MSGRVVVLGDALLDVRTVPTEPVRPGSDVQAQIGLLPGGQGANLAVRLARRGMPVELIAAVADDPGGAVIRSALEAEGVALRAIDVPSTGAVVVLTEPGGERTMLSHRAPFGHLVSDLGTAASWVVVSGYLLTEPTRMEVARRVAASPSRRAILGCAVPGGAAAEWLEAARAVRPHLVVLNEAELERLGTIDGLGLVAVTDAGGARVVGDGPAAAATAPFGPPALDTTGAGDAFAAVLIASLEGASWPPTSERIEAALRDAVAFAGTVARVAGAQGRVAGEPAPRIRA